MRNAVLGNAEVSLWLRLSAEACTTQEVAHERTGCKLRVKRRTSQSSIHSTVSGTRTPHVSHSWVMPALTATTPDRLRVPHSHSDGR